MAPCPSRSRRRASPVPGSGPAGRDPGRSDEERVRALREVLTATGAGIYLATHVAGPLPAETMTAVHDADELELRLGRVGPDRAEDLELREWEARAAVAAALRVSFEQVVLAHGAPEAAQAIALHVLAMRGPGRPCTRNPAERPRSRRARLRASSSWRASRSRSCRALESVARAVGRLGGPTGLDARDRSRDVALVVMAHLDRLGRLADASAVAPTAHRPAPRFWWTSASASGAAPRRRGAGRRRPRGETHRWLLGPEGPALAWLAPDAREGGGHGAARHERCLRARLPPGARAQRGLAAHVRGAALGRGPDGTAGSPAA